MPTYSIKDDGSGGFAILVSRPDEDGGYTAITLATRERAAHWIAIREELDKAKLALEAP